MEISKTRDDVISRLKMTLKHPKATLYYQPQSVRKLRSEPLDPYRNVFEVDFNRISDSKAFRRLKHKTQVIWAPSDAHIRTRQQHTVEVINIATTISRILGLNEDLTKAIAQGHDIGHPPFGHSGERALKKYIIEKLRDERSFNHHEQTVKILQEKAQLEVGPNEFIRGLNLTEQVVDGLKNCSYESNPQTFEARVVCIADDIAFVLYDYEELKELGAVHRNGYVNTMTSLGKTRQEREDNAIKSVIENSNDDEIKMGEKLELAIEKVKKYEKEIFVSEDNWARKEKGAKTIINLLMDYLINEETETIEKAIKSLTSDEKISFIETIRSGADRNETVITYVAYMTDTFALRLYRHLFSPETINWFF